MILVKKLQKKSNFMNFLQIDFYINKNHKNT